MLRVGGGGGGRLSAAAFASKASATGDFRSDDDADARRICIVESTDKLSLEEARGRSTGLVGTVVLSTLGRTGDCPPPAASCSKRDRKLETASVGSWSFSWDSMGWTVVSSPQY